MNTIITSFLQNYGLNSTDTKIYLDIYTYGRSYASSISLRTKIDRTTVYSSLKRLIQKGIVVQTKSKDIRSYIALTPNVFIDKLDNEIDELQNRKKVAHLFINEMSMIKSVSYTKPRISIYEGEESIINLYEQSLIEDSTQKAFLTLQKIPESIKNYLISKFIKNKVAKNVKSKVIISDSERSQKYKSLDRTSNRETKIISKHPFDLHSEVVLFDKNKVGIIDFHEESFAVIIESSTLYTTIESIFDYIWDK